MRPLTMRQLGDYVRDFETELEKRNFRIVIEKEGTRYDVTLDNVTIEQDGIDSNPYVVITLP
jgi:hypothetical protein